MNKKDIRAIATLSGATIGAGILGLPYIAAKAGLLSTTIIMTILTFTVLYLNLYIGEISLRTKNRHELSGYVGKYWNKFGKTLMTAGITIWILGALTAYTLGVGQALHAIFPSISALIFSAVFYLITASVLFMGLHMVARSELVLGGLMLFFISVILIVSVFKIPSGQIPFGNLSAGNLFLPIGVILFALMSEVVIPELKPLVSSHKNLKKVIIIGTLFPAILYLLFAIIVSSVVGVDHFDSLAPNEKIATIPLGQVLGPTILIFANLFAVMSMSTSFLALGLGLIWTLRFDYRVKKFKSWAIAVLIPVPFILSEKATFISAMDFAGAIAGGVTGIILVITFHKARRNSDVEPAYKVKHTKIITPILILIFLIAVFQQIIKIFI